MSQDMSTANFPRDLTKVREGMKVYDRNGKDIGKVDRVYMGSVSEKQDEYGEGASTPSSPGSGTAAPARGTIVGNVARAFGDDEELPDVLQKRLLREGFVRVEGGGLLGADRYVTPDQIVSVSGDRVDLRVAKDELIKR